MLLLCVLSLFFGFQVCTQILNRLKMANLKPSFSFLHSNPDKSFCCCCCGSDACACCCCCCMFLVCFLASKFCTQILINPSAADACSWCCCVFLVSFWLPGSHSNPEPSPPYPCSCSSCCCCVFWVCFNASKFCTQILINSSAADACSWCCCVFLGFFGLPGSHSNPDPSPADPCSCSSCCCCVFLVCFSASKFAVKSRSS